MINGLDIERFRTTMAAIENDHTKGKEVERMARFIPQAQMKQTLAKWTKVAESGHQ